MKVLVTGAKGQLGYDVVLELKKRGFDAIGVDILEMDITNQKEVEKKFLEIKPDGVIHCAAFTAVDKAEDEKELAYNVNVKGTENIVKVCKRLNCKMIYISTDYVFDGKGIKPFLPEDKRNPLNQYGLTKYQAEMIVEKELEKFFIVRISWVFGVNGNNFVKTMLKLAKSKNELTVINDQIGTPTYTVDLSRLLVDMIQTDKYGYYHVTNQGGFISWYNFACEIIKQASYYDEDYKKVNIIPVSSNSYLTKAKRPLNSRLDTTKLAKKGFMPLETWQNALSSFLKQIYIEEYKDGAN